MDQWKKMMHESEVSFLQRELSDFLKETIRVKKNNLSHNRAFSQFSSNWTN